MKRIESVNSPTQTRSDWFRLNPTGIDSDKNVALGWNEKRLYYNTEHLRRRHSCHGYILSDDVISISSHVTHVVIRWILLFLGVIYAIQSVALFRRQNFDFKFMVPDHKWLNWKLIKTFYIFKMCVSRKFSNRPWTNFARGSIDTPYDAQDLMEFTQTWSVWIHFENGSFLILHIGSQHDEICFLPSPRTLKWMVWKIM